MHADELALDPGLVRQLVDQQFPQYAALPVKQFSQSGSSNTLFRLGDTLLLRFPRQPGGGAGIIKEQRWLGWLEPQLPVRVPQIVGLGAPTPAYPEAWSIVRWLDGELVVACDAHSSIADDRTQLAEGLADLVAALRDIPVPDPASQDPALRWYRGRSLAEFDRATRHNIEQCKSLPGLDLDLAAALAVWATAVQLPGARASGAEHWYHADLVAENLLLRDGALFAALDFGGLAVGNPVIDLHGAWEVLDVPGRELFRRRLDISEEEWLLGRAWALAIALGAFSYYWDKMPGRMRDRLCMARAVLADVQ